MDRIEPGLDIDPLFERLANEHEQLRLRRLELLQLLEDEVSYRVDWEIQAANLQRELDALRSLRLMKLAAPLRRLRARFSAS
ncbi:MAG: hypothetical protein K8R99_12200 [Actinomycetia bacterium]|nr:hypothetical protein [Actinomycetes bacterium]